MISIVHRILDTTLRKYKYNCPSNIKILVFDEIYNSFLDEYYKEAKGKPEPLNRKIGKEIREYWNLKNTGRCSIKNHPLIKSYEKHSN